MRQHKNRAIEGTNRQRERERGRERESCRHNMQNHKTITTHRDTKKRTQQKTLQSIESSGFCPSGPHPQKNSPSIDHLQNEVSERAGGPLMTTISPTRLCVHDQSELAPWKSDMTQNTMDVIIRIEGNRDSQPAHLAQIDHLPCPFQLRAVFFMSPPCSSTIFFL